MYIIWAFDQAFVLYRFRICGLTRKIYNSGDNFIGSKNFVFLLKRLFFLFNYMIIKINIYKLSIN
jgi:hypothetical protein